MANSFVKAEQVVRQLLGLLEREIVLPRLVWRDAGGSFKGAKDDTISIRLPAYTNARTRVLRGGRPITVDELTETKVDITLDTDVYKAVKITDEDRTLDIVDFGAQVVAPVISSVARGIEDAVVTEMDAADYETVLDIDETDPYLTLLKARTALNLANVPNNERFLVVGAEVEEALLASDHLSHADQSGSPTAFRDATIGRIAGFTAVSVPALPTDTAIAGHRTAFVLSMQAPVVPEGVTEGRSESFASLAMRLIFDYDFLNVQDRMLADVFIGTNSVLDSGTLDSDGRFVPSEDGEDDPIMIRAVKLTLTGS